MAADDETFPWPSHDGRFRYFEDRMTGHDGVAGLTSIGGGVYELTTATGKTLRLFVCDCYAFGVAEYMETVDRVGEVDAVVIQSLWRGYTSEAKRHCRDRKVGLFKVNELMGALNRDDFWNYGADR